VASPDVLGQFSTDAPLSEGVHRGDLPLEHGPRFNPTRGLWI